MEQWSAKTPPAALFDRDLVGTDQLTVAGTQGGHF